MFGCARATLDREMTSESILSREGSTAVSATEVALALVDRGIVSLEIMLAREGLAALDHLTDVRSNLVRVMSPFVRMQVEQTCESTPATWMDACKTLGCHWILG